MVELLTNLTLAHMDQLNAGQRYALPDGLERALVAEGRAVYVHERTGPSRIAAIRQAPARKRREVTA